MERSACTGRGRSAGMQLDAFFERFIRQNFFRVFSNPRPANRGISVHNEKAAKEVAAKAKRDAGSGSRRVKPSGIAKQQLYAQSNSKRLKQRLAWKREQNRREADALCKQQADLKAKQDVEAKRVLRRKQSQQAAEVPAKQQARSRRESGSEATSNSKQSCPDRNS